jgi:hypothetical protein
MYLFNLVNLIRDLRRPLLFTLAIMVLILFQQTYKQSQNHLIEQPVGLFGLLECEFRHIDEHLTLVYAKLRN